MPLLSQRGYAEHRKRLGLRGGALLAVQRAIKAGRIPTEIDPATGKVGIDPAKADPAWEANTDHGKAHYRGPHAAAVPAAPAAPSRPDPADPLAGQPVDDDADLDAPPEDETTEAASMSTLAQAQLVERRYKARMARLSYMRELGKLIDAEEAAAAMVKVVAASKTRLMGLPGACRSRMPHLSNADINAIDELVREALEELAAHDPG